MTGLRGSGWQVYRLENATGRQQAARTEDERTQGERATHAQVAPAAGNRFCPQPRGRGAAQLAP